MPGENSPNREKILRWFASSMPDWPALEQLSEEQNVTAELMADRLEQIAKDRGLPLEYFTWDDANRKSP